MTITVENIGKAYPRIKGRWQAIGVWLGLIAREQNWIIRGVDFQVGKGEAVGIIGVNGAGKSTLLKMISGTSVPTEGSVRTDGRIAALLELGMGFHPEFTGRQNVLLAARMQGIEREQAASLIPAIEQFAEIGDYFDQPVRTYSSGMFVRLAFSVATAVRPEVLIVDEALAVGDVYFQHKSFARIREFREQGTTLLFVSHDPGAIKSLCDRAILLGEGKMLLDGKPDDVLDYYNSLIARKEVVAGLDGEAYHGRSGNGKARIVSLDVSSRGHPANLLLVGAPLTIRLGILSNEPIADLSLGFMIKDRTGYDIYGTNTWLRGEFRELGKQPGQVRQVAVEIPALLVGPGSYSLTLALHSGADHLDDNYDWWDKAVVFQVVGNHDLPHFVGACALQSRFEVSEPLEASTPN